ncbi:Zinc finger protein 354B [Harpegnathos saltator]|uniref:Zinc finger protein 354B n=1 Tax=Harpegnathos saltator TaxID=610380 RepID=E2BUK2_HARSA|nr:Zinc finger protein 354B [Harpegnathos saltator]
MDMTKQHLDMVERSINKCSNYNCDTDDMSLKSIQRLQPNKQEGTNIIQPGPSLENNLCGKDSTKESSTKKYKRIPIQCDICKQIFRRKQELIDHCEKVHKRSIYKCKHCDYETNCKSNFKRHEKTHVRKRATNSGDYMCTEPGCNKIYKNKYDFKCHIKICQYKNKMKSNNMGPGPSSESNLYFRKKNEMYKLSKQCRICGQIFCNKKMLVDHSMKVHQHCVHICEDETCSYETNNLRNMQKHFIRMHMNNKN